MLKSITIKLIEIEKNAKKQILDHFNAQSTKDLDSTMMEWKNDTRRKLWRTIELMKKRKRRY